MAVHCEKFDEERAERVIKNCSNVIMQFFMSDMFSVLPTKTLCFACLPLVLDKLTHKMDLCIVLVVSPLKEKTCWMPLCIKPGNSNFNYIPAAQV